MGIRDAQSLNAALNFTWHRKPQLDVNDAKSLSGGALPASLNLYGQAPDQEDTVKHASDIPGIEMLARPRLLSWSRDLQYEWLSDSDH